MKNNKNIIIIFVLLIIAGAFYGTYRATLVKESQEKTEPRVEIEPNLEMNFSRTGNILSWDANSQANTQDWTLLYEDPGKPAESVGLIFNEKSICNLGKEDKPCDKNLLNNGDSVKIEGNKQDTQVIVIKLQKLN